jgi:hypothetical protein
MAARYQVSASTLAQPIQTSCSARTGEACRSTVYLLVRDVLDAPEGARRLYAVKHEPLRDVDAWLDRFRRFWSPHLDALSTELTQGRDEQRGCPEVEPTQRRARRI